jgi:transposase-like protein
LVLSGAVESDECYQVAGQKGMPKKVKQRARRARRRKLKGKKGRGSSQDEKNPILGFVQRGGLISLHVVDNVQQKTIKPIMEKCIEKGSLIYTDEYNIYSKLEEWGYAHKSVNHGKGEYARDEDGDGFCEVHCNTQEGIWSLLRSWLRPHRGVSQEKLPFYVGFFEWIHNLKKRGKKGITDTFSLLLKPDFKKYEDCILSV